MQQFQVAIPTTYYIKWTEKISSEMSAMHFSVFMRLAVLLLICGASVSSTKVNSQILLIINLLSLLSCTKYTYSNTLKLFRHFLHHRGFVYKVYKVLNIVLPPPTVTMWTTKVEHSC